MEKEVRIHLSKEKIEQDKQWDGLKGYITNSTLENDEIIENYKDLWQIEKAFRIAKSDLEIRPIYHRTQRRIEAHISIAFVAYKIYKELERQLKKKRIRSKSRKGYRYSQNDLFNKNKTPYY